MKYICIGLSLFAVLFTSIAPAQAASQDECAIWLCLPLGFSPSECSAAKSALIKRVRKFKPPLPSFSSCAANPPPGSGSHMTSDHGFAAYIPAHKVCDYSHLSKRKSLLRRVSLDGNEFASSGYCTTIPEQYVKNAQCVPVEDGYSPRYCTHTYRWAEVFIDGELAGPTYYFDQVRVRYLAEELPDLP